MKSDLRNVKVGDWLFTIQSGWVKVIDIVVQNRYQIVTTGDEYNFDGKYFDTDAMPSAWPFNPLDPNDHPPVEFKVGQVIAVKGIAISDDAGGRWYYRIFEHTENYRNSLCYKAGSEY
jgi:hypothetical protein